MPIYRPSRALRVRTTATSSLIDTSWTIQHEGRDLLLKLCSPTQMHRQPTFSRVGASGSRCPKSESTRTLAAAEEDIRAIDRPLWTLTEPALSRSPTLPVEKYRNTYNFKNASTELSIFVLPPDAVFRQRDLSNLARRRERRNCSARVPVGKV